ncbi:hypothetical protein L0F63_000139 [Massospora cicadina]|nr:hypothetical protein L0F63_000139 [Massospora cicadina]
MNALGPGGVLGGWAFAINRALSIRRSKLRLERAKLLAPMEEIRLEVEDPNHLSRLAQEYRSAWLLTTAFAAWKRHRLLSWSVAVSLGGIVLPATQTRVIAAHPPRLHLRLASLQRWREELLKRRLFRGFSQPMVLKQKLVVAQGLYRRGVKRGVWKFWANRTPSASERVPGALIAACRATLSNPIDGPALEVARLILSSRCRVAQTRTLTRRFRAWRLLAVQVHHLRATSGAHGRFPRLRLAVSRWRARCGRGQPPDGRMAVDLADAYALRWAFLAWLGYTTARRGPA